MIKFFGRRTPKVDPAKLDQQTAEVNEKLKREGPKMEAIAQWLENRKDQNGIGEDFEITLLRPRGVQ